MSASKEDTIKVIRFHLEEQMEIEMVDLFMKYLSEYDYDQFLVDLLMEGIE